MISKRLDFTDSTKEYFALVWFDHLGGYTEIKLHGAVKKQSNGRKVGKAWFDDKRIYVDITTGIEVKEKDIPWYLLKEDFTDLEMVVNRFRSKKTNYNHIVQEVNYG